MDLTRIPMDLSRMLFIKSYRIHWIFMKLTTFRVSQAPSQPKTMRQTKYLDPKASHEKNVLFEKIIFSQKFSLFSRPQNPKIRDLTDLAMCTSLTVRIHQNPSKSEDLMLVEKIDLEDKKSPKIENFIFCFFTSQSPQKKILDTLRVPLAPTAAF